MSIKTLIIPTLNQSPRADILPELPQGKHIPRIVHQTFYDAVLPSALERNVSQIKALNPEWEYRFYDDAAVADFIAANYPPRVLEYFHRIDPRYGAARADLFRYLLIYKVGGVYLDIKSSATRPLDSVLKADDRFLLSVWEKGSGDYDGWGQHYELREFGGSEFQQWYIASAPGHPFLRSVIENVLMNIDTYIPSIHGTGKPGVLRVTGPIAYSLAIHRMRSTYPHRVVDSKRDLGLEYSTFRNNGHKAEFKSHYSLQTHPLVKMSLMRRPLTHLYRVAQLGHDLVYRRH
jgi:mannosyltransferase OCH1-like enzyme